MKDDAESWKAAEDRALKALDFRALKALTARRASRHRVLRARKVEDYRALINFNYKAVDTPPHIRGLLLPPVANTTTTGLQSLNFLISTWNDNRTSFRCYHDLYVEGLKLLKDNIPSAGQDLQGIFAQLDDEKIKTTVPLLAQCLNYLCWEDPELRYDPSNESVFWTHTLRGMWSDIKDELQDILPRKFDFLTTWEHRNYLCMHYSHMLRLAIQGTSWDVADGTLVADALVGARRRMKIAAATINPIAKAMVDRRQYSSARKLLEVWHGRIPDGFSILNIWARLIDSGAAGDERDDASLAKLLELTFQQALFSIGREWEVLCRQILRKQYDDVSSDLDNQTTLLSGKRPDFAVGKVHRRGELIEHADCLIDAKKSLLAISDDIELYQPYCGDLKFYVLDDEPKFRLRGEAVSVRYASEILSSIRDDATRAAVIGLISRSKNIEAEVQEHCAAEIPKLRSGLPALKTRVLPGE